MPNYDFKCRHCGLVFERNVNCTVYMQICPTCHTIQIADRQPCAPAFNVNGYNAKNGYSKGANG